MLVWTNNNGMVVMWSVSGKIRVYINVNRSI
jgi:hypothetical protein